MKKVACVKKVEKKSFEFSRFKSLSYVCGGEVAERSIATVLKTVVLQGTGGSNPSFSARSHKDPKLFRVFFFDENEKVVKQMEKLLL